jgi:diaminohydroxyphosphoribosylaminopyrimidine deaminase/5-amino-6-(5-phosphoribosylamino)uracil reductase
VNGDERWMDVACEEARQGLGRTAPNPAVGCVLVRGGRIVGRGHHRKAGGPHAEIVALADAGSRARGATAYVTLEPCCHHGKTPPCADALILAGVSRVVAGCRDPNPLVAGKGLAVLRRAGIEAAIGVSGDACQEIVRGFRHWIARGTPRVTLKLAASMDGRIAARGGESKWISSRESRAVVQQMRARSDAILVGVGTVLADNPRLTCRLRGGPDPRRIVLDTTLRTPPAAKVVAARGGGLIFCAPGASAARRRRLEAAGAEIVEIGRAGGEARRGKHENAGWKYVLPELGRRGVHELLIEGGAGVATSALRAGVVNELTIFYNARLIGSDGVPMVGELGVRSPAGALRPVRSEWTSCGPDLVWTALFEPAPKLAKIIR